MQPSTGGGPLMLSVRCRWNCTDLNFAGGVRIAGQLAVLPVTLLYSPRRPTVPLPFVALQSKSGGELHEDATLHRRFQLGSHEVHLLTVLKHKVDHGTTHVLVVAAVRHR